jgi:flagellar hook-associated protein 1 FlgK
MSFDVNGTPAVGDQFVVQRNTGGVEDGRNALLFARLQTQNTVSDGTATFQSAYARLVADNGIRAREAKVQLDAQGAVRDQAVAARESLSGVNLDEEAANMLKYQQAYQAASKILEIGNKLFDTILSLG